MNLRSLKMENDSLIFGVYIYQQLKEAAIINTKSNPNHNHSQVISQQQLMFSENKGYYYQEEETELFERQLPYRSVKIPLKNGRPEKILRHNQTKHEIDQLRLQILERCKFEELQYLELLKRQRESMEEDIRRRKQQMQLQALQAKIVEKKGQTKHKGDSLDVFAKQEEEARARAKTQRAESAYSNSLTSISKSRVSSHKPAPQAEKVEQEVKKQQGVQQMKQELMEKYRFRGEAGKAQKKAAKDQTQVKWWVQKVRQYRQEQAKGKPISEPTVLSDTDSNQA